MNQRLKYMAGAIALAGSLAVDFMIKDNVNFNAEYKGYNRYEISDGRYNLIFDRNNFTTDSKNFDVESLKYGMHSTSILDKDNKELVVGDRYDGNMDIYKGLISRLVNPKPLLIKISPAKKITKK